MWQLRQAVERGVAAAVGQVVRVQRWAGRWPAVVTLVVVAGLCGAGFVLVYRASVWTTPGRRFGDWTLRGASLTRTEVPGWGDQVLNVVSVTTLLGALAAVAVIGLVRLQRSRGLAAVGVLAVANVAALVLKRYVLPRPDLGLVEVAPATLNSLPSGHSTAAFSVVVAVLFVVPARLRVASAVAGIGYGSLTALATVSAGWHRAGDSVAAFLLVAGLAAVAGIAVVAAEERSPAAPKAALLAGRVARWFAIVATGLLCLGVALGLVLAAGTADLAGTAGLLAALLASAVVVVGSAVAATAAVLLVLDRLAPAVTVARRPRGAALRPARRRLVRRTRAVP